MQYLAEVLVWMGGRRVWPEGTVVATLGGEQRARVVRDLATAERAGIIVREAGGVRLTDQGWDLAAGDGV